MARTFTKEQQAAIDTRDKTLLVSAAAGSGKTATLTERIIVSLLDETAPLSVSDLLVVTFTNAAVGELRERITAALRRAANEHPENARLAKELLAVRDAKILTIDGFCNELLRAGAETVGLSPRYRVADTAEAALLASSVMEDLLQAAYAGDLPGIPAEDFIALADCLTGAKDEDSLANRLLSLYRRTETAVAGTEALRPLVESLDPDAFRSVEETATGAYIMRESDLLLDHIIALFEKLTRDLSDGGKPEEKFSAVLADDLDALSSARTDTTYLGRKARLEAYLAKKKNAPPAPRDGGLSAAFQEAKDQRKPILTDLVTFTRTFFSYSEAEWRLLFRGLKGKLTTLTDFLTHFSTAFREEKRRRAICEYSDMERYAYEFLYNEDGTPSDLARSQAARYKAIYIDEYQDVNELQNRIFEAISRPDNRFMVGDIKQSIYAFRSADPRIFARMKETLPPLGAVPDAPAASLFMSKNFRSDPVVIDYVNDVFDAVFGRMGESIGYTPMDRLTAGKLYTDGAVPCPELPEIHYMTYCKETADEDGEIPDEEESIAEAEESDLGAKAKEAAAIISGIARLLAMGKKDDGTPIRPEDIAVLTRNNGAAERLAEAVRAAGIPAAVRGHRDFFLSPEVLLALSLLNVVNNPRRDIYLAGLLRSPLYGFTADELVLIRSAGREVSLYDALCAYTEAEPTFTKGRRFLTELARYREIGEGMSVDDLIARLYRETGLLALAAAHGGRDNLILLHNYARTYEKTSYKGLYSFIGYINRVIEENQTFDAEPGAAEEGAVVFLTEHRSKGLEYPVVILADATRHFSAKNDAASIEYAEDFGIALQERDPSGIAMVSNPVFSAIRDYREARAYEEDMRILYVALTRARERLFVYGCYTRTTPDKVGRRADMARYAMSPYTIRHFSCPMDLLLAVSGRAKTVCEDTIQQEEAEKHTTVYSNIKKADISGIPCEEIVSSSHLEKVSDTVAEKEETGDPYGKTAVGGAGAHPSVPELAATLGERFSYRYPAAELTVLPEKLSVSRLSPSILDETETEDAIALTIEDSENRPAPPVSFLQKNGRPRMPAFLSGERADESALRGIATHMFLQFCDTEHLAAAGARAELDRLVGAAYLSEADAARVRLDEIEAFIRSDLCREMREAKRLWRELRFHVALPAADFTRDEDRKARLSGKNLLVQGVIDCLVERADGSLLLADYKTDRLRKEELADPALAAARLREAHTRQLSYYRLAVCKMFGILPARTEVYSLHLGASVEILPAVAD